MKPNTLPVKRRPASKGIFKRLNAVTNNRKQRVAAASAQEFENEDSSSKISRALTIIFLIHIVAIGLIFVHQKFLDGKTTGAPKETVVVKPAAATVATGLPKLKPEVEHYMVVQGDNYKRIADKLGLGEPELRDANNNVEITTGLNLNLPPKRIVAQDPPEIAEIHQQNAGDADRGLVENVDTVNAPRATLVRPNVPSSEKSVLKSTPTAVSGKSYVVKSGDSVWRIANHFKVDQKDLMKANNISDARKMKVGMSLVIP